MDRSAPFLFSLGNKNQLLCVNLWEALNSCLTRFIHDQLHFISKWKQKLCISIHEHRTKDKGVRLSLFYHLYRLTDNISKITPLHDALHLDNIYKNKACYEVYMHALTSKLWKFGSMRASVKMNGSNYKHSKLWIMDSFLFYGTKWQCFSI